MTAWRSTFKPSAVRGGPPPPGRQPRGRHALTLQGQTLLDEGKLAAAAASFRRAWKLGGDERARQLLRETLLEGLRSDFAAYRPRADEIEQLLDNAAAASPLLASDGGRLQKAGESLPALEQFLRLVDLERGDGGLEEVDRSLLVRRDRWIRVGLASLRREAAAKAAAEIDRIVGLRLKTALEAKSADSLAAIRRMFRGTAGGGDRPPGTDPRLAADKHWLEAEMLLWRDWQSPSAAVAGPAVAQLAEILEQAGSLEGAAVCCRQLQGQFADVALPRRQDRQAIVRRRRQPRPWAAFSATKPRGRSARSRSRRSLARSCATTLLGVSPSAATATAGRSSRRRRPLRSEPAARRGRRRLRSDNGACS